MLIWVAGRVATRLAGIWHCKTWVSRGFLPLSWHQQCGLCTTSLLLEDEAFCTCQAEKTKRWAAASHLPQLYACDLDLLEIQTCCYVPLRGCLILAECMHLHGWESVHINTHTHTNWLLASSSATFHFISQDRVVSWTCSSLHPNPGIIDICCWAHLFAWAIRIQIQVLMFAQQPFYGLIHLPSASDGFL